MWQGLNVCARVPDKSEVALGAALAGELEAPAGDLLQHRVDLQLGPDWAGARWSSSTRTPTVIAPAASAPAAAATVACSARASTRRGGQHRHLPAADGCGGVGRGHGVPEGRLKARRQRHGPTLRRTATARQAASTGHHRGWLCNPYQVHEQRQRSLLIGYDHDLIATVMRQRSATSVNGTGGP